MDEITVVSVNVGTPRLLGIRNGNKVYSSIAKHPVREREVYLTPTGLAGDQQTDTHLKEKGGQLHGGPKMAVYAYPMEHFAVWSQELFRPIGPRDFGENLTISGLTEKDVRAGDVWAWGDQVRLQVTKPRTPCYKLCMHLEEPDMIELMMASGRCGWYLSVVKPGVVPVGGPITVVERAPDSAPTIRELFFAKAR